MSRLPSPFQQDLSRIMNSPQTSTSPGFLMMTRPPNAVSDDGGRNTSRGHHRGYQPRNRASYSNNSPNNSFMPFRNQNNRGNHTPQFLGNRKHNSLPSPSPNKNYYNNMRSFSGPQTFQSTPSNFNNSNNGKSFNKGGFFNANKNKHDTPLKDIPVDKFVSRNMIQDPWETFSTEFNQSTRTESMFLDDVETGGTDYSIDDDGTSMNESLSTTQTTDFPMGLSDGDSESDAASDD